MTDITREGRDQIDSGHLRHDFLNFGVMPGLPGEIGISEPSQQHQEIACWVCGHLLWAVRSDHMRREARRHLAVVEHVGSESLCSHLVNGLVGEQWEGC